MRPLFIISLLIVIGIIAYRNLPPEWDPAVPLDLRAEPGLMTRVKVSRLAREPEACFAAFAASGMLLTRVPDRPSDVSCGIENAVLLPSSVRVTPRGPTVTCRVAAAWALFERHSLQPAARQHLGTEVVGVRHLGTYSCRNVNSAAAGRRSQHATANAIDIAALLLGDGREVRLVRDWHGDDAEAAFLRAIRDGACRWFRAVLSPDYNAAHADHFHFDMGPSTVCR
ncbi:extensin family protein [Roseomonas stagni]|uniref:Extensin family protein n=1 Tax=Falsiroseomonas algicola TaxID=2716930 RepID=A0A6M1LUL8_9PROT|nr:extensin family protein [Falsiroseomonas algicola]